LTNSVIGPSREHRKGLIRRKQKQHRSLRSMLQWCLWRPSSLNWWVTFTNLVGCGGFMIAALSSFVPPHSDGPFLVLVTLSFSLIGALGFLIGSLLILAE
jgi:hypothetical protein